MNAIERGRARLLDFEKLQPENFWRADPHARRVLRRRAGEERFREWEAGLDRFGAACAGPINAAVIAANLPHNLPRLERYSAFGERIEAIEFHPSYHEAGRSIYGSGVMSVLGEPGNNLRSFALFYLSAHNGEAGHNCPLACTAGLIRALRHVGDEALRARTLPRLLSSDYDQLAHGAQFLTEVQGGSDVGANAVRAVPDPASAAWRIHGEKWFCSNASFDLALVTARPEGATRGTAGLGLFLLPRRLPDGTLNAYRIRRLKDKLGTRSMASGEIDFDGAVAWPVGPLEDGFENVMTYVINTSRVANAFGCCGNARRALLVAHAYARTRSAFGAEILAYPMTQETLADMRVECAAMLSGSLAIAERMDGEELGRLDAPGRAFLRMALNLNKLRSALSAHEVIVSGIEVLGGNGAIETFSVLPRLLRDNVVYENWEGSHNVLLLQVLRDCRRKSLHEGFFAQLAAQAGGHARLAPAVEAARRALALALEADDAAASLLMRGLGNRLAWLQWACAMVEDGSEAALLDHFLDRRLGPAPQGEAAYLARIRMLSEAPRDS